VKVVQVYAGIAFGNNQYQILDAVAAIMATP
jgi:hypothetical protein